jgi:hypothetical protein
MRKKNFLLTLTFLALSTQSAFAGGWNASVGYHNPPSSTLGVNAMYLWTNWAFEAGLGNITTSSTNNGNNTNSTALGGDVNFKYLFGAGFFRPFVHAGVGVGVGAGSDTGLSAGTGGAFLGGGAFLMGRKFYGYGGANLYSKTSELFLGLGIAL